MIPVGCRHPSTAWLGLAALALLAGCSSPPPPPKLSPAEVQARQFEILDRLRSIGTPSIDFEDSVPAQMVSFLNARFDQEEAADSASKIRVELRAGEIAEQPITITGLHDGFTAYHYLARLRNDTNLLPGFIGPDLILVSRFDPPEGFVSLRTIRAARFYKIYRQYHYLLDQLEGVTIPAVDFQGLSVHDAIGQFNALIEANTPAGEKPVHLELAPDAGNDPSVTDTVTLELRDVPASEVLDFIMTITNLQPGLKNGKPSLVPRGDQRSFTTGADRLRIYGWLIEMRRKMRLRPPSLDPQWPTSVDEAVNQLLDELNDEQKQELREMEDTIGMHFGLGLSVRNRFGLWQGNLPLLADTGATHPDNSSGVITYRLWKIMRGKLAPPPPNLPPRGLGWPDLLVGWEWVEDTPALLEEIRLPDVDFRNLPLKHAVGFLNRKIFELNEYDHDVIIELHPEADGELNIHFTAQRITMKEILQSISTLTNLQCGVVDGKILLVPADQSPEGFVSLWESPEEESAD
ncbi:MAG: DUF6794 domain-containing protein [Verrucomicrobiota bacterium]